MPDTPVLPALDRRGALVVLGGVGGFAAYGAVAVPCPTARLMLFDVRSPLARRAAGLVRAQGGEAVAVEGDVTRVWQDRLRFFWAGGGDLFGVTTHDALFCLDHVGRDAGQRLAWSRRLVRADTPFLTGTRREHDDGLPMHGAADGLFVWLMVPKGRS